MFTVVVRACLAKAAIVAESHTGVSIYFKDPKDPVPKTFHAYPLNTLTFDSVSRIR